MQKDKINWDMVVPEAYIILNPRCAAAKVSKAEEMTLEGTVATAVCAEKFFNFPVIYIEYSGMYGDPNIVKSVKEALTKSHLLYGGGINTKERAEEMSKWATIVVGNTIYENGTHSFIDTMRGNLLRELTEIQGKLGKLKRLRKKTKNEIPQGVNEKITKKEEEEEFEPIVKIPKITYKNELKEYKKKSQKI